MATGDSPTISYRSDKDDDDIDVDAIKGEWSAVGNPLMALATAVMKEKAVIMYGDETANGEEIRKHPGPIIETKDITGKEQQWLDVGSDVFARTFAQAQRLLTTTRGGPPIRDVHRRTIWSLSKGRIIDDCIVDDVADEVLNRWLLEPDDIRIELTMKDALDMYQRVGADVAEIYSQPRITQAAAEFERDGIRLQPGWSLDLTKADPLTGRAWDLSQPAVQSRVFKMLASTKPLF